MAAFKANYWKCVLAALLLTLFAAGTSVSVSRSAGNVLNNSNINYSVSQTDSGVEVTVNGQTYDQIGDAINAAAAIEGTTPEQAQAVSELADFANTVQNSPEAREAVSIMLTLLGGVVLLIGVISCLLRLLVFNPLEIGCRGFFTVNSDAPAELSEIKTGFNPFGRNIGAMFLRDLFIVLWSLLFVVPGIIKAYSYRMVPYILAEDPEISGRDAITLSRQMMDGQKWNTFVLDLSFIGWDLLSAVTGGLLGLFYVNPYKHATGAELYQVLRDQ
jgi:hypothetical protein